MIIIKVKIKPIKTLSKSKNKKYRVLLIRSKYICNVSETYIH